MSFDVGADDYGRFMGRWSERLAGEFLALLDPPPGGRALDVGCGPGAMTARLVDRLGAEAVAAVDPSPSFVAAARSRLPGVDVRPGVAASLPFDDDAFDLAVAQLVVHFMPDPVAGLAEMARVTRPGGTVAACVWDHAGGSTPLSVFWQAARDVDPGAHDEGDLPGARRGHLEELFGDAGLREIVPTVLSVSVQFGAFEEWWEPFTLGVGPAGGYVAGLDDDRRTALRERCVQLLPPAPFRITASAWCVTARA